MAEPRNPWRELREALDPPLTQEQLGEVLGVTGGRICHVETREGERLGHDAIDRAWNKYAPIFTRLGFTLQDLLRGGRKAA
jgi:hypothetical protein